MTLLYLFESSTAVLIIISYLWTHQGYVKNYNNNNNSPIACTNASQFHHYYQSSVSSYPPCDSSKNSNWRNSSNNSLIEVGARKKSKNVKNSVIVQECLRKVFCRLKWFKDMLSFKSHFLIR